MWVSTPGFDFEVLHGFTTVRLRSFPAGHDGRAENQHAAPAGRSIHHTATFGVEKTAEGLQALQWFKEGRMLEIAGVFALRM